jgi:exosortase
MSTIGGSSQSSTTTAQSGPAKSLAGLPTSAWIMIALLAAGVLAMFFRWILKQHDHSWTALQDWGHAYVIPALSIYLIWLKRAEIMAERPQPFWPALSTLLLGLMCYAFFIVGVPNHMFQGASLILTLESLALFLLGPRIFRHLFLPIALLGFGVTISEQIMNTVTFRLQLIASQGAWFVLSIIGGIFSFIVELEGNTLTVAGNKLNVAEACSGMRMVVSFYALAAAVGVLGCNHWWQRTALFLLAGPVAILMNIVRVAVLGLLSLYNMDLAAGEAHMMIGTLLLLPSLLLFMSVVWALNKIVDDEPAKLATVKGTSQ